MPKKSKNAYFAKRGVHFGNMWAVYSLKCEQVLLLGSDRQLAHWLLKLEFSPAIKNFSFQPGRKEVSVGAELYQIDYHVEVFPSDGPPELHYLRTEGNSFDYAEKSNRASRIKYRYCEFNDADWAPEKNKILPLLKVSSFLSGGRHAYVPQSLVDKAIVHLEQARQGSLRTYLSALNYYDQNLCLLVFCRLYASGVIAVDFDKVLFDMGTRWWVND
ncbi:hypothetical protein ACIOVF_27060 [Pseudomonas sp. NPDC087612]|uniref:hypothetical protein n=1 Tax=Pseudomonas sp. NPDC087612 TaxID=3364441 RepID=UPI0037FE3E65